MYARKHPQPPQEAQEQQQQISQSQSQHSVPSTSNPQHIPNHPSTTTTTSEMGLYDSTRQVCCEETQVQSWIHDFFAERHSNKARPGSCSEEYCDKTTISVSEQQKQQEQQELLLVRELPELFEFLATKLRTAPSETSDTSFVRPPSQASYRQTVQALLDRFYEMDFQQRLGRLYKDRGVEDPEVWATRFYEVLRDSSLDNKEVVEAKQRLEEDCRVVSQLLYNLVDQWHATQWDPLFEAAIDSIFLPRRLLYILGVCLPLQRARAMIYQQPEEEEGAMNISLTATPPTGAVPRRGMHWFSRLHLDPTLSPLSMSQREDLERALMGYTGSPTMDDRIFRLCWNPRFGLSKDPVLYRWCQPVLATHLVVSHRGGNF